MKQNFLSQNNTFENDNNKKNENKREKQIGIIKNITNLLPHRDSNQYNIKINHYKKKEKSMDCRNNLQNLFFLKNISSHRRQNEDKDNVFKDNNRKFLSPVKISSNLYKNKRKQICETEIYRNDYSNNNFRMNDKLIINLTNDGEKNKNYKNDKRYFIKNLNFNKINNNNNSNSNNTKNKEKDYLHHLYNLKMKNHSPIYN